MLEANYHERNLQLLPTCVGYFVLQLTLLEHQFLILLSQCVHTSVTAVINSCLRRARLTYVVTSCYKEPGFTLERSCVKSSASLKITTALTARYVF